MTASSGQLDEEWAKKQLLTFHSASKPLARSGPYVTTWTGEADRLPGLAHVAETVLSVVLPDWRSTVPQSPRDKWGQLHEACARGVALLHRRAEIAQKLGDLAPQLSASALHPWIWEGARSLWQSGHFADAVRAATVKLNAEMQNKIGRKDLADVALFQACLSPNPAKAGDKRLYLLPNDGSKTFESRQKGAIAMADGLYSALRNVLTHTTVNIPANEALEMLAAFSILARWIDQATVTVAP